MEIVNLNLKTLSETQLTQAAQMLTDELPFGWPTLADAKEEINELIIGEPDALFFGAVEEGELIGWVGLLPQHGKLFEIHPLVVWHDKQRKGVGTILVNEVTNAAREKGGLTLTLGAGDEEPGGETSFANVDLYDNLPKRIAEFEPGTHQTAFYIKLGFKIIGVIPNVYGIGKPDILLAKNL